MDDLARLRVEVGIVLLRLEFGENVEGRVRKLRSEEKRLQAGDDRVTPEDGHEPRDTRAGQLADARVVGPHPQRREVGDGLPERVRQRIPRRAQLRHAQLPRRERVTHAADLFAEPPLCETRRYGLPVRERDHLDVEIPALARL